MKTPSLPWTWRACPANTTPEALMDRVQGWIDQGLAPPVAHALALRGVLSYEEAAGQYRLLPFHQMKGLIDLSEQLAGAIVRQESIVVVADYDCDGATACAVMVSGIEALGGVVDFVVPNRFIHGYGLTPSVIDTVLEHHQPLWIVTVDNGIASIPGVEYANSKGIKVLVTDHHLAGDRLPPAAAIANPNQPGCPFPSKNLAGVGVAYYTIAATQEALKKQGKLSRPIALAEWLDLVALGTIADVVRLDSNNRWLVRAGLKRIREGKMRPGIRALFIAAQRSSDFAISADFGFGLGPRINAAGRLDDMSTGIRCLLSDHEQSAISLALELDEWNKRRRSLEADMKTVAWDQLASASPNALTRVVYDPDFHEGVIGIVAGRIKEVENCPTIVFAPAHEAGWIKGSGRSIPEVHLRDALDWVYKKDPTLLPKFGGHAMAAGLTIPADRLDEFKAKFEEAVAAFLKGLKPSRFWWVDGALSGEYWSDAIAMELTDEVWGQGFEEPIWVSDLRVVEATPMGKDQEHLRLKVEASDGSASASAVWFHADKDKLIINKSVKVLFRWGWNTFRGEGKAQMQIVEFDVGEPENPQFAWEI